MGKIIIVDLKLVEDLAGLFCTQAEVCKIVGISERTLRGRVDIAEAFKKGSESGKVSLRRMQFKLAEKSPAMAIFLGKQYLGQRDEAKGDADPVDLSKWADALKGNYSAEGETK